MRVHMSFSVVRYTHKKWVIIDGIKKRRQKTFEQTINPFNVNAKGAMKTRSEIMAELQLEALAWENE